MTDQTLEVVRPASEPDAPLACDFTIASNMARENFREELARGIIHPVLETADGIEVSFRPDAWDAVLRYVDLESRCCPFLNLAARKQGERVLLTVTGRPEARALISTIFSAAGKDCC